MKTIALCLLLAGCTTTEVVNRPNGQHEIIIACGAASGWNICYSKANEVCPTGYETLQQSGGFNRKELWIKCPSA